VHRRACAQKNETFTDFSINRLASIEELLDRCFNVSAGLLDQPVAVTQE
jgi:hypothetical protein